MRFPPVSGHEAVRALSRLGFQIQRQRGSHIRMVRPSPFATVTVPMHTEIKVGTLLGMRRRAGVSRDEFLRALR